MTRIDGAKIRSLRESKGLTQLYLSTVVGVTTDTISRWENRRYPSIKLENAEKLAHALEVDLVELFEQEGSTDPDVQDEKKNENVHIPNTPLKPFRLRPLFAVTVLILAGICLWLYFSPDKSTVTVNADRVLPPHVAPGQTFPVLIRVETSAQVPVTFIMKESFPEGCAASSAIPAFTTVDHNKNNVKWIARAETGLQIFAYIVQAPVVAPSRSILQFNGSVTLKQETKKERQVQGASGLTTEPYHWADTNKDNIIDDEEILAVYDIYCDINELRLDIDLIDTIWSEGGYSWNTEEQTYIIQE